jgi:hypothetical protein
LDTFTYGKSGRLKGHYDNTLVDELSRHLNEKTPVHLLVDTEYELALYYRVIFADKSLCLSVPHLYVQQTSAATTKSEISHQYKFTSRDPRRQLMSSLANLQHGSNSFKKLHSVLFLPLMCTTRIMGFEMKFTL